MALSFSSSLLHWADSCHTLLFFFHFFHFLCKIKRLKSMSFCNNDFFSFFFSLYLIWFSHKFSFLSFAGKNEGNYVFVVCSAARGLINHILYESERLSGRKFSKSSWCCFRFFIFLISRFSCIFRSFSSLLINKKSTDLTVHGSSPMARERRELIEAHQTGSK